MTGEGGEQNHPRIRKLLPSQNLTTSPLGLTTSVHCTCCVVATIIGGRNRAGAWKTSSRQLDAGTLVTFPFQDKCEASLGSYDSPGE